jgi:hypothetical protein
MSATVGKRGLVRSCGGIRVCKRKGGMTYFNSLSSASNRRAFLFLNSTISAILLQLCRSPTKPTTMHSKTQNTSKPSQKMGLEELVTLVTLVTLVVLVTLVTPCSLSHWSHLSTTTCQYNHFLSQEDGYGFQYYTYYSLLTCTLNGCATNSTIG